MKTASCAIGMIGLLIALPTPDPRTDPPPPIVPTAWLRSALGAPDLIVLAVAANEGQLRGGRIPGARLITLAAVAPNDDGRLPPVEVVRAALETAGVSDRSRVVLYGEPMVTARVWAALEMVGLGDRAGLLDGGLSAWRAAGASLTTEAPLVEPGRIAGAVPRLERFVDAAWVERRLDDPSVLVLDVREDDEYSGADGGHGGAHAIGHIPGATHLNWNRLFRPDGTFLPPAELAALFRSVGGRPGRTIVPYCMVGLRASVAYLAAKVAGMPVRLFPGSIIEWGAKGFATRKTVP
ncbi:MAG: sulfurtransferase [Gemmatimonadales bacterium]